MMRMISFHSDNGNDPACHTESGNGKVFMKQQSAAYRIARDGIFIALALIFGYVESLIPFHFGVPGIKLGLANIVIVTGLYFMELPDICLISLVRIIVSGLLFGNLMSLVYSLAGGRLSLAVMLLLRHTGQFSVVGVSMAGGVFHNVGQIIAAVIVTGVSEIVYYLPVLMGTGLLTGFLMGIIAGRVLQILKKSFQFGDSVQK